MHRHHYMTPPQESCGRGPDRNLEVHLFRFSVSVTLGCYHADVSANVYFCSNFLSVDDDTIKQECHQNLFIYLFFFCRWTLRILGGSEHS